MEQLKSLNIWVIGVYEGEGVEKVTEKVFEEIMAETFSNLKKTLNDKSKKLTE